MSNYIIISDVTNEGLSKLVSAKLSEGGWSLIGAPFVFDGLVCQALAN
jgi:hypothetical protein